MLSNQDFLYNVQASFNEFINCGTSRSTAKLKPLHGAIAADIAKRLGSGYKVWAQGYGLDKEKKIEGRYIDKYVDITIDDAKTGEPLAGIAVKFVMQNYSQNSNNYFENMLGETANIRAAKYLYFQVFIIIDKLPYYDKKGNITKWEEFSEHNMKKYCMLSKDNVDVYMHTPNKTLIYVIHVKPEVSKGIVLKKDYFQFYKDNKKTMSFSNSTHQYQELEKSGVVILNDYELFMEKVYYSIKSI